MHDLIACLDELQAGGAELESYLLSEAQVARRLAEKLSRLMQHLASVATPP